MRGIALQIFFGILVLVQGTNASGQADTISFDSEQWAKDRFGSEGVRYKMMGSEIFKNQELNEKDTTEVIDIFGLPDTRCEDEQFLKFNYYYEGYNHPDYFRENPTNHLGCFEGVPLPNSFLTIWIDKKSGKVQDVTNLQVGG